MKPHRTVVRVAACVLASSAPLVAGAQEMEPRAFSPSPIGVEFFLAGYARSTGGILTDPSLPVDDVHATIDSGVIGYGRTFSLLGHLANAGLIAPYVSGHFTGTLNGEDAEASRTGFGDLKLRLATNLIGGPALTPAEFVKRTPATTLGVSLTVSAPTGEYYSDKLVNIGTNRWAVKPEIGLSRPVGRWTLEAMAGAWFFEDNDNFFGGKLREQDPLVSVQAHVSYTFRPKLWLAFNATFYDGGRTTIDGVLKDDRQSSARYGLTFSMPLSRSQSIKVYWNDGATARIGSDFTTYGVTWQYTRQR